MMQKAAHYILVNMLFFRGQVARLAVDVVDFRRRSRSSVCCNCVVNTVVP